MANSLSLKDWLVDHATRLDLQAVSYDWTSDWIPPMRDFIVHIRVGTETFSGRGVAPSPDDAFVKAAAEALERAAFSRTELPSTNGLALHEAENSARASARREIIERDAFFCHHLTNTPFNALPQSELTNLTFDLFRLENALARRGIRLRLGRMRAVDGMAAVACGITGRDAQRPFGVRLGLGCHESLPDAVEHAICEALRGLVSVIEGTSAPHTTELSTFKALERPRTLDHEALGMDLAASLPTENLFKEELYAEPSGAPAPPVHIDYRKVELPAAIADAPVAVLYASSSTLQPAVFGRIAESRLNFERLQQFAGPGWSPVNVNRFPHVFG